MATALSLAALVSGLAGPLCAWTIQRPDDSSGAADRDARAIQSGLDYIRSGSGAGTAMSDYIQKDPLPIQFGSLDPGHLGEFRESIASLPTGESVEQPQIVLDRRLRQAVPELIGNVIFHEYVHRFQERDGQDLHDDHDSHTPEGLAGAMEFLRAQVRPWSGEPLKAPEKVRRGFEKKLQPASFEHAAPTGGRRVFRAVSSRRR